MHFNALICRETLEALQCTQMKAKWSKCRRFHRNGLRRITMCHAALTWWCRDCNKHIYMHQNDIHNDAIKWRTVPSQCRRRHEKGRWRAVARTIWTTVLFSMFLTFLTVTDDYCCFILLFTYFSVTDWPLVLFYSIELSVLTKCY